MDRLIDILRNAEKGNLPEGWLFIEKTEGKWSVDSKGMIIDMDSLDEDEFEDDVPKIAIENSLVETFDDQTIEGIAKGAKVIENPVSDDTLIEAFNYYFDYDAFLPEKGFVPLPNDEWQNKQDLDFYDSLGDESEEKQCKKDECSRGVVKFSPFCRIHHFEMIQNRKCPFEH